MNSKDRDNKTPLHRAIDGVITAQQVFWAEGGTSPLVYAPIVCLLLNNGADERSRNTAGQTPRDLAATRYPDGIMGLFRQADELRQDRYEAFAMGQLEGLGAESLVQDLDAGVVRMILEL